MSTTTDQLLALAKEAADLTNVIDYVTDPTWVSWLNAANVELHRFVTNKFKATFYRTYDFTLTAGQSQIALPANFWRLKGLDVDPDTVRRRTVRPYNFAERNQIRQDQLRDFNPLIYAPNRWYNVIGSSLLKIQAQEQAAGNYRLYYVPKPKTLASVRTFTVLNTDSVQAAFEPGLALWSFANFGLNALTSVGDFFTISGCANVDNDGSRFITEVEVVPSGGVTDTTGITNETFDGTQVATYTTCMDPELEPYAEYVWLTAARKSLMKEESYQQAKVLADQIALIRADLTESLETDQGGPATIIDTDDWSTW